MGFDLFSNADAILEAKKAAGAQQYAGMAGMEAVATERARGQANERAKMAVWGLLGKEGTYGEQNKFTQEWQNRSNVDDPTSLFDTSGVGLSQPDQALHQMVTHSRGGKNLLGTAREGILDPESYAKAISGTAQFRIQSKRVAESEQLLNQEGPAWDMLNNSVLGIINEGSALQLRDTMRKLKNQYAKGGTARRAAMFEANELMAGERAMRMRTQETWQANLALYDTIRQNADRVAAGTATFMQGLPLVNDSYRDAMQRTAALQIEAGAMANTAIMTAYDTKMTQQPYDFWENFVEGSIQMGPSLVGGAVDSYLGSKGGGAGGGGGGGGVQGALAKPLMGREDAGYTPRGYGPAVSGGGGMSDVGNMLTAAFDYMNQEPTYSSDVSGDLDRAFDNDPALFGGGSGGWSIDRG